MKTSDLPVVPESIPLPDGSSSFGKEDSSKSGPIYFDMDGKDGKDGDATNDDENVGVPPLLPPPLPNSGAAGAAGTVDPEFASLPDAPGFGGVLAMWSWICSILGFLALLLPIPENVFLWFMVSMPFFFLSFCMAIASFFKKPSVTQSVVALVLSILGPILAVIYGFFQMQNVVEKHAPEIRAKSEQQAAKQNQMAEQMRVPVGPLPKLEEGTLSVVGETNAIVPSVPTDTGLIDGKLGDSKVPAVLMPPEMRPSQEVDVVLEGPEEIIPPEERVNIKETLTEAEFLKEIWWEIERGLVVGAPASYRKLATKAANLLGYPYPIFSNLDPSIRLYLLQKKFESMGVGLLNEESQDEQLHGSQGEAAMGSMGSMGSVAKEEVVGPGPLPASQVVTGMFPPKLIDSILLRRKYGTVSDGVGKFTSGVKGEDVKKLLEESMGKGTRVEAVGGGFTVTSKFGRQVGWDALGLAATKLQLVFNADGTLQDAYPF